MISKVLLSTAYFPPVSYMQVMLKANHTEIETQETYHKQTYRNRCEIATAGGRFPLVVPVSKPQGNHTKTSDILISYRENWQQKHWKTLTSAYSSSPFFMYYEDIIFPLFQINTPLLLDYNRNILDTILKVLEVSPKITYTSSFAKNPKDCLDLRQEINPKTRRQKFGIKPYPQVFENQNNFLEDLSILDVLFNLGPETLEYLSREF